jgi:hypothetical protein
LTRCCGFDTIGVMNQTPTHRMEVTNMAKAIEDTEVEVETVMTPKALATELEVNPKSLRAFLRREFPRSDQEKNTTWKLTEAQVEAARKHFSDDEEVDEDSEEFDAE